MKVKVEDLETNETREKELPFATLRQLQGFLINQSSQAGLDFYILLKGRGGKFIEVWSSDGKKLLERYTPSEK